MISNIKKFSVGFFHWCNLTSRPLGWCAVVYGLLVGIAWLPYAMEKTFFTATCTATGWKCEYSYLKSSTVTADSGYLRLAQELSDPDMQIEVIQTKKK